MSLFAFKTDDLTVKHFPIKRTERSVTDHDDAPFFDLGMKRSVVDQQSSFIQFFPQTDQTVELLISVIFSFFHIVKVLQQFLRIVDTDVVAFHHKTDRLGIVIEYSAMKRHVIFRKIKFYRGVHHQLFDYVLRFYTEKYQNLT